jgi:hypothetical protein
VTGLLTLTVIGLAKKEVKKEGLYKAVLLTSYYSTSTAA